ncbi:MAG: hypothetical protein QNJ38_01975 [Prochloraceae cyanobacterium]|nr:hypothetical protein [Prochloraceae cyanobacterium]
MTGAVYHRNLLENINYFVSEAIANLEGLFAYGLLQWSFVKIFEKLAI